MRQKATNEERTIKRIHRVLHILNKLDQGKPVYVSRLAEELDVTVRSIQRDIRLLEDAGFPLAEGALRGSYVLMDGFKLGRSQLTDREWSLLLCFKGMADRIGAPFQKLMDSIIQKNLHPTNTCDWFYLKTDEPAGVNNAEVLLSTLINAIRNREILGFTYRVYSDYEVQAKPFKIAQYNGFWYLVAEDTADSLIKKYALDRIKDLDGTGKHFDTIRDDLAQILDESFNIWFGHDRGKKVLIEASADVADYFRRRKWFPNQEVVGEKENGNLVISYVVSNFMEIIPFLKSWLPHVWVVKPERLRKILREELEEGVRRLS
ncbi:MAG TPA: WYL domain-containing protein [Thermodesulfobacteriota bacterium]|nr:WYL domain-containing protein [Thermodesulfobacteriota bacterium]HQO76947.1 WYL domain-containing protein [Thermodesulfobacteriota bacterium]